LFEGKKKKPKLWRRLIESSYSIQLRKEFRTGERLTFSVSLFCKQNLYPFLVSPFHVIYQRINKLPNEIKYVFFRLQRDIYPCSDTLP